MPYKVLITDYAWPSLNIERSILAAVSAEPLVAGLIFDPASLFHTQPK